MNNEDMIYEDAYNDLSNKNREKLEKNYKIIPSLENLHINIDLAEVETLRNTLLKLIEKKNELITSLNSKPLSHENKETYAEIYIINIILSKLPEVETKISELQREMKLVKIVAAQEMKSNIPYAEEIKALERKYNTINKVLDLSKRSRNPSLIPLLERRMEQLTQKKNELLSTIDNKSMPEEHQSPSKENELRNAEIYLIHKLLSQLSAEKENLDKIPHKKQVLSAKALPSQQPSAKPKKRRKFVSDALRKDTLIREAEFRAKQFGIDIAYARDATSLGDLEASIKLITGNNIPFLRALDKVAGRNDINITKQLSDTYLVVAELEEKLENFKKGNVDDLEKCLLNQHNYYDKAYKLAKQLYAADEHDQKKSWQERLDYLTKKVIAVKKKIYEITCNKLKTDNYTESEQVLADLIKYAVKAKDEAKILADLDKSNSAIYSNEAHKLQTSINSFSSTYAGLLISKTAGLLKNFSARCHKNNQRYLPLLIDRLNCINDYQNNLQERKMSAARIAEFDTAKMNLDLAIKVIKLKAELEALKSGNNFDNYKEKLQTIHKNAQDILTMVTHQQDMQPPKNQIYLEIRNIVKESDFSPTKSQSDKEHLIQKPSDKL